MFHSAACITGLLVLCVPFLPQTSAPSKHENVNAVLMADAPPTVVHDQRAYVYDWRAEKPALLSLTPLSVPAGDGACAFGIRRPCPESNVQIKGLRPGATRVLLRVIRQGTEDVLPPAGSR